MKRIYLDNAATTWPKPEEVYRAVDHYQRNVGAAAGRGASSHAIAAQELVESARRAVARLLGIAQPRQIAFTLNGTDALNTAIHGTLQPGDHVVTTVAEHNSVLRPLAALEDAGQVEVTRVACDGHGVVDPADIRRALRPNTRLVALVHASNVTGMLQPAGEIGRITREHGTLFLLDAAQSAGEMRLDVEDLAVDLLAAPGHKGLLGPLGTGVLYVRPEIALRVRSFRQGGTGTHSESDRQPGELPEKFEAGNLNVPGIAGLGAGAQWIWERGVDALCAASRVRTQLLIDGLAAIAGVTLYGSPSADSRVGVVSMTLAGYDPHELAATLEGAFGVQTRAGLHCAPAMHRALGTVATGGTVRFGLGPFTTDEQIRAAVVAVAEVAAQLPAM